MIYAIGLIFSIALLNASFHPCAHTKAIANAVLASSVKKRVIQVGARGEGTLAHLVAINSKKYQYLFTTMVSFFNIFSKAFIRNSKTRCTSHHSFTRPLGHPSTLPSARCTHGQHAFTNRVQLQEDTDTVPRFSAPPMLQLGSIFFTDAAR